ncbi:5401_t:CDS:2, partial [Diversispora eburnea]
SKRSVAAKFNIEPKQLRDWLNKKEQLLLTKPHIKKLSTSAKPRYPIFEIELFKWIKSLHSNQKVVSRYMIQEKAKILSRKLQYTTIYPNILECKWGNKWLERFMCHYKLSNRCRTTIAQSLIGNMDETPLTFDMPSNMTVEETGSRTVSIHTTGHEKSNFTV